MPFLPLPSPHPANYYLLFYLAGFAVAGFLLVREGYIRHYPWRLWLPLVAATLLSLILGTRLIAGSSADWQHLLTHAEWTGPDTRSILGGLLGATLALAALRRLLGFGRHVYDAFALPFLVGLAVQGIGCLLTGCCFGTAAPESFGVCYAPGTLPFLTQVAQGKLAATAALSLPIHAAQVYQIILCLLIAGLLRLPRCRAQAPGQQFIQALLLYAAGRFGLEFLRDAAGDVVGSTTWHGLKQVQWLLLVVVIALTAVTIWRSQFKVREREQLLAQPSSWRPRLLLGLLLLATALLGPSWLTGPEQLVVKSLLLACLLLEAASWLRGLAGQVPQLAMLPTLLGFSVLLFTNQAPAPEPRHYTTVSVAGMAGTSEQYLGYPNGCSGSSLPPIKYQQQFKVGSIGIARTIFSGARTFTFGADLSIGRSNFRLQQDDMDIISSLNGSNFRPFQRGYASLYSISPYVELNNRKHIRFGVGAHIGNVAYDYGYEPGKVSPFRFQSLFEVGWLRTIYFHSSINYGLQGLGNGFTTLGLGTGAGQERLRVVGGIAFPNSQYNADFLAREEGELLPFLQASIPIGQRWTLEPFATTNFGSIQDFRLRTSFRLPTRASATKE